MSKLKASFIKESISTKNGFFRSNVVPPNYGLDTSIIGINENIAMAVASDPLSYIPRLGAKMSVWLSIQLVANDIATTSLEAQYGQLVLNLPSSITEVELEEYWSYIDLYSKQMGITITGGHTGIALGNESTIAGGITLWTFANPKHMLLSSYAQEGEIILMTKSAGLLSTSLLAILFSNSLNDKLSTDEIIQLKNEFWNISIAEEAKHVRRLNTIDHMITATHDVTEGGVLGALYEFCSASRLGASIKKDNIPIASHVQKACKIFGLDPLKSIGAGSMLISCKAMFKDFVINALITNNILCTEIGYFTALENGRLLLNGKNIYALEEVEIDPYWAVFNKMAENEKE